MYMTSIVAAFVDVDKVLIFPEDACRLCVGRTSYICARPMTISPLYSVLSILWRLKLVRYSLRRASPSSSDDEKDKTLESWRLVFASADPLVLDDVCD